MANKLTKFIGEVKSELKKVSWSTRRELLSATSMVIMVTALLAVFIGGIDFLFSKALRLVIR